MQIPILSTWINLSTHHWIYFDVYIFTPDNTNRVSITEGCIIRRRRGGGGDVIAKLSALHLK